MFLTTTPADAGKTIPLATGLTYVVTGDDSANTFEIAAGAITTISGGGGTDVIKFLGSSSDYTVALSGTNAVFTRTADGSVVTIPVQTAAGGNADTVQFGTGAPVVLSSTGSTVSLGAQTIAATSSAVTGATGTAAATTVTPPSTSTGAFTMTSNAVAGVATAEGNTITLTITPTAALAAATTLNLNVTGQALGGYTNITTAADFGTIPSVSFAAGATAAQTVSINVASDTTAEGIEAYKIALLNSVGVEVATSLTGIINDAPAAVTGNVFTLTSTMDNVTSGFNTVSAVVDQLAAAGNTTWSVVDTVAPAAGATINLTLMTGTGVSTSGLSTTGATTLNIKSVDQNVAAHSMSLDIGSMSGLTSLKIANGSVIGTAADTLTVSSIGAGNVVSVDTAGQYQNSTFNFAAAATAGAADTVTGTIAGRNGNFVVGTGFETVAITSSGTAARVGSLTSTTATKLTVAGTGLKVDAVLDSTLTNLDASASTGNVDLYATGAATLIAIKGGAGTADKLSVNTLSSANVVSGFETINASTAASYDLTNVTGVTTVGVDVSVGAVVFNNVPAATKISLSGANQRTTALDTTTSLSTGGALTYTLKTGTGASDAVTVLVDNGGTASTGTFTVGGLTTLSGVEQVTLTATDWKALTFTGITDAVTSTGNFAFTASATATNLTFGTVTLSGALSTGINTFNLGAVTGTTSATFIETENFTYTGGTGVDTVTAGAVASSLTQTYNTGAGNDVVNAVAADINTSGTLAINTEAGDDTIALGFSVATANIFNIDGGAGTLDTLKITAGTSFIDSMIGIEKISNQGAVTTTIAGSSVTANNTVEITQIAAGFIAFTAASGQTVNLSGVTAVGTVDASKLTLTGSTGAETLTGSSTVGVGITSGLSSDTITLGTNTAQDIITTTVGAAYTTAAADRVTGFVTGVGADILQIDISDSTLIAGLGILTAGNGANGSPIAGDLVIKAIAKDAGATALASSDEILVITGTYGDTTGAALIADLGTTGILSWSTNNTTTNGFLVVWYDGTHTHVSAVSDAGADATMTAADLAVTDIILLVGDKTAGVDTINFTAVA